MFQDGFFNYSPLRIDFGSSRDVRMRRTNSFFLNQKEMLVDWGHVRDALSQGKHFSSQMKPQRRTLR